MHLNLSTTEWPLHCTASPFFRALGGTVGTTIVSICHAVALPPQEHRAAEFSVPTVPHLVKRAAPDTQQSSTVRPGLFNDGVQSLISDAAKAAIGEAGMERLQSFFQLKSGWDGRGSQPISLASLETFSRFFRDTALRPGGLGTFMSAQGNLVVNWHGENDELVELEFHASAIDFFIEHEGQEGIVSADDIGFTKLLSLVEVPALA